MQKKPEKMFRVLMFRQDLDFPIVLLETDKEDEAVKKLNNVEKEWTESAKEQRPFRLSEPYKEVFISSLILKVNINEMSLEEYQQSKDPLHQEMQKNGTSEMMNNLFQGV